jgi:BirA family transcriptional regulator, biotin operon repressor / biotin---[acetyl-CoA-carboxylase] ligase
MEPTNEWHLDTHLLGRRVLVFDQVGSTNAIAADFAHDPANEGIAILAKEQIAGRGQYGRTWVCQPGAGVLLSVLVFPPPRLCRPVILAAWAANSICEAIEKCAGLEVQIKWPNDVLIEERKVCGILIEQAKGTVAGIGLNVNQDESSFVEQNLPHAGSLAQFAGRKFECDWLARLLITTLDEEYHRLCQGDLATLESCWQRRIGLLGKEVVVECSDARCRGRLGQLRWDGVQLEVGGGNILRLVPEVIKHITEL